VPRRDILSGLKGIFTPHKKGILRIGKKGISGQIRAHTREIIHNWILEYGEFRSKNYKNNFWNWNSKHFSGKKKTAVRFTYGT